MVLTYSKSTYLLLVFTICFQLVSCAQHPQKENQNHTATPEKAATKTVKPGADRVELYLSQLLNKNVAIVANQTSIVHVLQRKEISPNVMGAELVTKHLVDYLHDYRGITVKRVFAPEHGFRGKADAGETVIDGVDTKTGVPIISLYGKNKKPFPEQLQDVDVVVFDIQDVGVRFYTYISTLHYVMEACAEANIPLLILDRPNPNAHYIDGPTLEMKHTSFVGMHPVPVVYGMTIGEYGKMINGEKWLKDGIQCDLTVIPIENYTHQTSYSLPVKPSPNLPNDQSINLYPSLCFFEGTNVSVGRGTSQQFQVVGSPFHRLKRHAYNFTPQPNEGAKNPKHLNKVCYGYDLSEESHLSKIELKWLLDFYHGHKNFSKEKEFFNPFFTKLAGTEKLQLQIEKELSEEAIRKSWEADLANFKKIRSKYLIYP
ncbi:exo-beta-N-acetylmuramidase NamZ family protein [Tenacibaculum sp. TC6]|uniref:exo-beta-N-acetylmuramidase NamZ family protein n=1 Tax=Tenacibaculum sp. TC6 TaxID=3423223 RepID=UPI003D36E655